MKKLYNIINKHKYILLLGIFFSISISFIVTETSKSVREAHTRVNNCLNKTCPVGHVSTWNSSRVPGCMCEPGAKHKN